MVIFSEMFDKLENEDANVEGEMEFENPDQNETMESRRVADRNSGSKSKKNVLEFYSTRSSSIINFNTSIKRVKIADNSFFSCRSML